MKLMFKLIFYGLIILTSCNGQSRKRGLQPAIPAGKVLFAAEIKPVYNIFLENSGSMDGYVEGVTDFEQAVYNFLVDIKINHLTESMNLNYINSEVITNKPDVQDFIAKLEPKTFQIKGG